MAWTLASARVALVAPARFDPLKRHWKRRGGVPAAATVKVAVAPAATVRLTGCWVMVGSTSTVRVARALVTEPELLATTTWSLPAWTGWTLRSVTLELV